MGRSQKGWKNTKNCHYKKYRFFTNWVLENSQNFEYKFWEFSKML